MVLFAYLVFIVAATAAVSAGPCCLQGQGSCCGGSRRTSKPDAVISHTRIYNKILTVTNGMTFGGWKDPEFCPSGTYASGFQLKVEKPQGGWISGEDDTALNAIKLFCRHRGDYVTVTSGEGPWGRWKGRKSCITHGSTRYLLSAFQLRVEGKRGRIDDTAANNIKFQCRPFIETHSYILAGDGTNWGGYGRWSESCPMGSSICGIQTRIESRQRRWRDDTALNDAKFFCCEYPDVSPTSTKSPVRPDGSGTGRESGSRGEMGSRGAAGAA